MIPQQPGHAPGWSWRRLAPASTLNPYATLRPAPTGCVVSGLCETGYHADCNQAPWEPDHDVQACPDDHPRRCACPCHTEPAINGMCQMGHHRDCPGSRWQPDHRAVCPAGCQVDHSVRCACSCHTAEPVQPSLFETS